MMYPILILKVKNSNLLISHELPLIPVILTDVHLKTILVLVLLAAELTVNCRSGHMLAYDVSDQVTPLGRSLTTSVTLQSEVAKISSWLPGTGKEVIAMIQHKGSYRFIMFGVEILG